MPHADDYYEKENMKKKICLNSKRLTKQEVHKLVTTEGKLHLEFTNCFAKVYPTGYRNQPLVYELTNDRFLFVFDPTEISLGGKGDIYDREYFLRWIRSHQRHQQDLARGCYSSTDHWHYYSQSKENFIDQIDSLIADLAAKLAIDPQQLDFSYPSLDIVTQQTEIYKFPPNILPEDHDSQSDLAQYLYDNLVAYVGEVLRRRVMGKWAISDLSMDESSAYKYPYLRTKSGKVLMPINVVWQELTGTIPLNWRQGTTNEIRRSSR